MANEAGIIVREAEGDPSANGRDRASMCNHIAACTSVLTNICRFEMQGGAVCRLTSLSSVEAAIIGVQCDHQNAVRHSLLFCHSPYALIFSTLV